MLPMTGFNPCFVISVLLDRPLNARPISNVCSIAMSPLHRILAAVALTAFAASPASGPGLLAGKYGGVTASAAAGIGLGADVLVGGTGDALSLQPLAVEGEPGIGIAAGVEQIALVAAK